jgi:hypothetical protein
MRGNETANFFCLVIGSCWGVEAWEEGREPDAGIDTDVTSSFHHGESFFHAGGPKGLWYVLCSICYVYEFSTGLKMTLECMHYHAFESAS